MIIERHDDNHIFGLCPVVIGNIKRSDIKL